MKLHHLRPAPGAKRPKTRHGRGEGSGHGKTAGRGTKGSRARGEVHPWFEGGQMPLHRRLPKLGGFTPRHRTEYREVNVDRLNDFASGATVSTEDLIAKGLVRKGKSPIKILGRGELTVALTVKANAFTAGARQKIESAGGRAEVL
ncbi:MAG TPA: 50S ribosomal protein L15 [Actinomycetota bacterium]